jgi:transposase
MDLSPAVVHGCRRDFIEAWTSLNTALSGGLHISNDEEKTMIAVGVDTHKERHYAVALDQVGQLLAELTFAATAAGCAELQHWAEQLVDARELVFGLEGAGGWGAGLFQHLRHAGHSVLEVERPRRKDRRAGKFDRIDALAAAKCVLSGENVSTPRRRGILTAIRALLIARPSAVTERTRVLNQLQALFNATAPIALRERIGEGTSKQLERRILSIRARSSASLEERVAFSVMRDLAAHSRTLGANAKRYEHQLADLIRALDETLLDEPGIGPISAAKLLAFDPTRFTSEGAFARCNGTAPIPASSGKTIRYRLNCGGDRQANKRDPHDRNHPRQASTRHPGLPRPSDP